MNFMESRYSKSDLQMFKELIEDKLSKALEHLNLLKQTMTGSDNNGTDDTGCKFSIDDVHLYTSKEDATILAHKQEVFILGLQEALKRIEKGTYGICYLTGELIDRNRLLAVPHTMFNIKSKESINLNKIENERQD
jgi:DnaK suppressor protein